MDIEIIDAFADILPASAAVEAAQAGLDVRDRDLQLGRDQSRGDGGVHVAVDHHQRRPQVGQDGDRPCGLPYQETLGDLEDGVLAVAFFPFLFGNALIGAIALVIGLTMVSTVSVFAASLKVSFTDVLSSSSHGDLYVLTPSSQAPGYSPEVTAMVREVDGVATVSIYRLG